MPVRQRAGQQLPLRCACGCEHLAIERCEAADHAVSRLLPGSYDETRLLPDGTFPHPDARRGTGLADGNRLQVGRRPGRDTRTYANVPTAVYAHHAASDRGLQPEQEYNHSASHRARRGPDHATPPAGDR